MPLEKLPVHRWGLIRGWRRLRRPGVQAAWITFYLALPLSHLSTAGQSSQTPREQPPTDAQQDHRAPGPGLNLSPGQPPPQTPGLQSRPNDSAPLVRLISPGVFEVGSVRLDKPHRTVSFPAVLNRGSGPMEYFLVTSYGKVHESILKTEASPYHIHIAMLLLGVKGDEEGPAARNGARPNLGPIKNPSKEILPGDRVSIWVSWKDHGAAIRHPAEELVFNQKTRATLDPESWVYNGSCVMDGRFLASSEGSIVSLVTDPVALLNNIAPGHDNDQIWTAATNNLPPANVPLEVQIKLPDSLP